MSKLLFWVPEKWPKLHIFVPSSQLELQRSMFSIQKWCLIGSLIWGNQKFYSIPPKNGFLAQVWPNLAKNWHFWPNIGIFGPFDPIPDQKTMQTRCLGGFSVTWVEHGFNMNMVDIVALLEELKFLSFGYLWDHTVTTTIQNDEETCWCDKWDERICSFLKDWVKCHV